MPQVVVTAAASIGLRRCLGFLARRDAGAARKAAVVIRRHLAMLEANPDIGRPSPIAGTLRELSIPFGRTGYVALYRHDRSVEAVYVLAFRHQREAGTELGYPPLRRTEACPES